MSTDTPSTPDATANSDDDDAEPTANARDEFASGFRQAMAVALGASGYGDRYIYSTFDWPKDPDAEDFYALYRRNPFAAPIVDRPATTSWRDPPIINDEGDEETEFQKAVEKANRAHDLWGYAERVDRLAGIGRFGLLVFVTADVEDSDDLAEPLPDAASIPGDGLDKVTQIKVFSEVSVDDMEMGGIDDADDGRWGLPISYDVDFETDDESGDDESTFTVHHSRTVAVPATRLLDDDFFGQSRLEPCVNALRDIEKVMGSVAELAFRGADKGLAINFDPEKVNTSEEGMEMVNEELSDWHHGIQPFLKLVGADSIQTLGGEIADPSAVIDKNLSAIAANTGIPKRVFEGDPAGALAAAEEDTQAFHGSIQERREVYNAVHIARPILQWFIGVGAIPDSAGDHIDIEWEPLRVLSEQEETDIGATKAEWLSPAITVAEAREMFGMTPQPDWMSDDVAKSYLSEMGSSSTGGFAPGSGRGPGSALDSALAANRRDAEAAARTEARIQRGLNADD